VHAPGPQDNIVLIGMPGVGKSTVGVLLAKDLSRDFIDTDVLIQARRRCRLRDLIAREGRDRFLAVEEQAILGLDARGAVIATGGSAVYSPAAMAHLKGRGAVVHLVLPLDALVERGHDLERRGVARRPGQDLPGLFEERMPLYRRYADCEVDCSGRMHEEVVAAVREALGIAAP
jgi:shikimate kinase